MIRQATLKDIPHILPLMSIIWNDMSHPLLDLVDKKTFQNIMSNLMTHKNSKFSYTNALVFDDEKNIKGVLYHYDGALEPLFNNYFIDYITQYFPHIDTTTLHLERETTDDTWYIDSIVVDVRFRGRGIARLLIEYITTQYNTKLISLNCEYGNDNAYQLYNKLQFKQISDVRFLGHSYRYMRYLP